jgi:rare lipoprotein A
VRVRVTKARLGFRPAGLFVVPLVRGFVLPSALIKSTPGDRCLLWVISCRDPLWSLASALPPIADIIRQRIDVRFGPQADSCTAIWVARRIPSLRDKSLTQFGHGFAPAHAEVASIYGGRDGLCGHRTASGVSFNCTAMTAAHRTLPFGTRVRVCYNGCVIVTINDRGPWVRHPDIDLSPAAARAIGLSRTGKVQMLVSQ